MPRPVALSYVAVLLLLALAGWLQLMTPLIAVLFCYFVLSKLALWGKKWISIVVFLLLVVAIFWGFVFFLRAAFRDLPAIVSTSVPVIVAYADKHGIDLPFTDMASLKDMALESVHGTLLYLGNFAKIATKEFVFLVIGVVIAIGVFVNPDPAPDGAAAAPTDLYSFYMGMVTERFRAFYRSFERVMGAQLLISTINTVLTACFVFACSLRYASLLVALTFVCGLFPIIGNIISNALIVAMAFTSSPQLAAWALGFLVAIHKLEYFLNSQIVGSRIRHPMWMTLLALIFGERLMGIPGIILAPVVLNFVKMEASRWSPSGAATAPLTVDGTLPREPYAAREVELSE